MSDFLSNLAARSLPAPAADAEHSAGAIQPRRASRFEPRAASSAALAADQISPEPELDSAPERIVAADAAPLTAPSVDQTALQQLLDRLSAAALHAQPAIRRAQPPAPHHDSSPPQLIPPQIAPATPHAAPTDRAQRPERDRRSDTPQIARTHSHAASQPAPQQINHRSESLAPRPAHMPAQPTQSERASPPPPQPERFDHRTDSQAQHDTGGEPQPTSTLMPLVREIVVEREIAPPSAAQISRSERDATPAAPTPIAATPHHEAGSLRPQPLQPQITRYIAPPPESAPPAPPAIQVTIGRIEVRATVTPGQPRPPQRRGPAVMTLEEYVRQRKEGGSR